VRKRAGAAVAVWVAATVLAPLADGPVWAVPPTSPDCKAPQAHQLIADTPWAVQRYSPARIWPLTTGEGVTVAVIDSGVDGGHPQLRGAVDAGTDLLDRQPSAAFDCVGHGTAVASIIAARPRAGTGFVGLAPGARIMPIRVSERQLLEDGGTRGDTVDYGGIATAINTAVAGKARVINLSMYWFVDDPRVKAAVQGAVRADVVVVAAAGNAHNTAGGTEPDRVTYPAAYEGVIGVGAIDETGARAADSQVGPFVDLVAPGVGITLAANRSGDHWVAGGTSFAAPHVAAAAALVRARWPAMSAAEVTRRLFATAGAARGGAHSDAYGYGEVDPYRAVNEVHGGAPESQRAVPVLDAADAAARAAARARTVRLATVAGAVVLVLAVAVCFAAWVVPRGRRRRWRVTGAAVTPVEAGEESSRYHWTLGPPPAIAHPDRAETERYVRMVQNRR
jgi:membrane-anchored mycosin MYCP